MKIYAYGQRGPGKSISEDCMMVGNGIISEGFIEYDASGREVIAVSDGVGGNKAGETASLLTMKGIREARLFEGCDLQKITDAIVKINHDIVTLSKVNDDYTDMAATLTGIYIEGEKCLVFHVGNTRLFVVNNGEFLRLLTSDHTNVNKWVKLGIMSKEEAENHPDKNVIYACMGGGNMEYAKPLEVTDFSKAVQGNRSVVLTSDGIHDYVSVDEMEEILLGNGSMKEKLTLLAKRAREQGSVDDISIIYFDRTEETPCDESEEKPVKEDTNYV